MSLPACEIKLVSFKTTRRSHQMTTGFCQTVSLLSAMPAALAGSRTVRHVASVAEILELSLGTNTYFYIYIKIHSCWTLLNWLFYVLSRTDFHHFEVTWRIRDFPAQLGGVEVETTGPVHDQGIASLPSPRLVLSIIWYNGWFKIFIFLSIFQSRRLVPMVASKGLDIRSRHYTVGSLYAEDWKKENIFVEV